MTTLIDLIREAEIMRKETGRDDVESVIATSMDETDVERLMAWPHTNIGTDGALAGNHPRARTLRSRAQRPDACRSSP